MFGTCPKCNSDHIGFKFTPDHTIKYCRSCGQTLKVDGTAFNNGILYLSGEAFESVKFHGILVEGLFFDDSEPTIPTNEDFPQDSE